MLSVLGAAGCGDAILCDGSPLVVIQSPTSAITVDGDSIAAGVQTDVRVRSTLLPDEELELTVLDAAGATVERLRQPVGEDGAALFAGVTVPGPRAKLSAVGRSTCGFAEDEVELEVMLPVDDQGPAVSVEVVQPAVACGAQITPASDVDPATEGVQVVARVTAAEAVDHALELTNIGGTASVPAPGDVTITVAPGLNLLSGVAFDALGNRGQSAACTIALADLAMAVAPPAADGFLGRSDGAISGSTLAFSLCGTVDRAGAAVTVRVDGGAPVPATVTGTDWCRTLALAEGPHAVAVTATKGASFGSAALPLRVDLTPPDVVTALGGIVPTRQRVGLSWTAPADSAGPVAAYVVKVSTSPLTEAGFDTQGTVIATGTPRAPGSLETVQHPARLGMPYWLGVASIDLAGNRSAPAIAGPITPAFDQLGPIGGPNASQGTLAMGAAIAHGRFNDDDFDDLAIAAPTQDAGGVAQAGAVYVYFGGPTGIAAVPQLSILGGAAGARAGSGLAAVRWSSATRDDLVIGAPGADGGAGRLFVLAGGAGFPTGTIAAGAAALQIGVDPTAPGWFAGGGLGAAAVAADVDGDGVRDLVASAIRGGGTGGIVIFYGGTVTASVRLSDTDTSGFGSAIVEYLPDPLALPGRKLGTYLHAVDPTSGPLDPDEDLVVAYEDDVATAGDSVYVIRGNGTRPAAPLTRRAFAIGRDVRIDLVTVYPATELGAQAVSIADRDGDGAAELAISAYRTLSGAGQVLIIDGDTVGTAGVARTTDPGVVLTTIQGTSGMRLGAALVAHDARSNDDVDGDGLDDLMVGAVTGGLARLFVWFGGTLPLGPTTIATAGASIAGPPVFAFNSARPHGPAGQARWVGDLNGDGLDDVCWASPYDTSTSLDGAFAVLLDGAP